MSKSGGKSLWEVIFNVGGKADPSLKKSFKEARDGIKSVQDAAKQLGDDWKSFASNAGKLALGVAAATTAVTVGVIKMADSVTDQGDEAAKTAATLGMGIEALQEWRYAMEDSGVSLEMFDSGMQRMTRLVREGAAGSETAAKSLEKVGLSAKELNSMAPEKSLEKLADYMKELPNDAERAYVANTLFGKSAGPYMMEALKQGSAGMQELMDKARKTGSIIDEETARMSEAYGDNKAELLASIGGIKNQFISGAIGPLAEAFKILAGSVQEGIPTAKEMGEIFGNWLKDMVQRLPEIIDKVSEFASMIIDTVDRVKDFAGGWENVAVILGGLAVSPTLLSGLKVVFSFGKLIHVVMDNIGLILTGIKIAAAAGFGGAVTAALPVIAIIAAIAAAIYIVVRNWDKIRAAAESAFNRIMEALQPVIDTLSAFWEEHGETVISILQSIGRFVEEVLVGAFQIGFDMIAASVEIGFDMIATAVEIGAAALEWIGNVVDALGIIVDTVIGVIVALFIGDLNGAIEIVKSAIGNIGDKFTAAFDAGKRAVDGFISFFSGTVDRIGNIAGNIGNKISGVFSGGGKLPGHAEGGIFTRRHIAEIAEKGAEAVVPLDKSTKGRAIWEQAGMIGGYLGQPDTNNSKTDNDGQPEKSGIGAVVQNAGKGMQNAISAKSMTPFAWLEKDAAQSHQKYLPSQADGKPPHIGQAARKRLAGEGGSGVILNFTQQNTFAGKPDKESIRQVKQAGLGAAVDIENHLDAYFSRKRRVSYE